MAIEDLDHVELTRKIIGAAMKVHRVLKNGFPEVIYQRALMIEFQKVGLSFFQEFEMSVFYEGIKIGKRRVDFFVEEKIMVELKAVSTLENFHLAQAINYLEAYNSKVGLLINFGAPSLQFKRLINKKFQSTQQSHQKIPSNNPNQ